MNTLLVTTVGLIFTIMVKIDAQSDKTLSPGERGADVVRAVISKIEAYGRFINFDSDPLSPLFMRAMAYVETRDGATVDPNGGGIWNVAEAVFDKTQSDPRLNEIIMQLLINRPENYFRPIDWRNLNYSNLSTPLYSGLAVRLLIHLNTLPERTMHATYWINHFKTGMPISELHNQWNNGIQQGLSREECKLKTDVVFVLDGSASIGDDDFQEVKSFVHNFSANLSIGMSRVGVITFSTEAVVHIPLNNALNKSTLLHEIDNLPQARLSTFTNLGLDRMRQQEWRTDISVLRLAIILTDGVSEHTERTKTAARMVHNHEPDILVFAIGVGNMVNPEELMEIASGKGSQFLVYLDSFDSDALDSVREGYSYQICYLATTSVNISTLEEGVLIMNATARFRFTVPVTEGMTFRICLSDGEVTIYASTIPNPSSAQYTRRQTLRADGDLHCLSTFYDFEFNNRRRKRRQISNDTVSLYITLEGHDDVNEFTFNSSVGNTILNYECKDEPCDPNAECFNTNGSYHCICIENFSGNGTFCFPVNYHLPATETKARDKIVPAVLVIVSVTPLAFVTITAVVVICGILLCFAFTRKKHNKKGNKHFKKQVMDTNGPLQFENEDKKDFEATCTKAEEIIPTSIGLTALDEDKSVDDNNY